MNFPQKVFWPPSGFKIDTALFRDYEDIFFRSSGLQFCPVGVLAGFEVDHSLGFGFFCSDVLDAVCFRRKSEVMLAHGLFSLLTERLILHSNQFTVTTYNVLFEVSLPLFLTVTNVSHRVTFDVLFDFVLIALSKKNCNEFETKSAILYLANWLLLLCFIQIKTNAFDMLAFSGLL